MSYFADRAKFFYENFGDLIRPYNPFVEATVSQASHVRTLRERLEVVVGAICGNFAYESDQHLYGQEDYWATADEVIAKGAGDCDCLSLLGSSVLFSMGVPHYLTMGHMAGQIQGLEATPEQAGGHVWLEVDDKDTTYLLEFTRPLIFIFDRGDYKSVPYVPVERIRVW